MNTTECPNDLCRHHNESSNKCYECGALVAAWISVKDRLPQPGIEILAYCPESDIQVAAFEKFVDYGDNEIVPTFRNVSERYVEVSHWMPLPKAPEGL